MDVKEAVDTAKSYVGELFAPEKVESLGLEEFGFDRSARQWRVTVGFSRPWQGQAALAVATGMPRPRSYKIVAIDDDDGKVISIKNRE
jgi:hypothetical protein